MKKSKKKKAKRESSEPVSDKPRRRIFRYRECKNCQILNQARNKRCTDCDAIMYEERAKTPPRHFVEVHWKDLEKGDQVFIMSNDVWFSPEGTPVIMSDSGDFKIIRLSQEGLLAYNGSGFAFFDMVRSGTTSKQFNIRRGETKIYKRSGKAAIKR